MGSLPTAGLETIRPRRHLQKESVLESTSLEIRVLLSVHFLVEAHFGLDIQEFLADTLIGRRQPPQFRETLERFLIPVLGGQPSGGERKNHHTSNENKTGDHLQQEGKSPGPLSSHEPGAIGDPVGDHDSENNAEFFHHQESTSTLGRTWNEYLLAPRPLKLRLHIWTY